MNAKEKAVIRKWLDEIEHYEKMRKDLWKELGLLYVNRGGGEKPTWSLLLHYEYLQTSADELTRNTAKTIWTLYHEANAHIDARMELGKALANVGFAG